jgi:hypothetical protein
LNDVVSGGFPPYQFTLAAAPRQGDVTVNPDGTFNYTANDGAEGSDSFTYTVTDSQVNPTAAETATGIVNITITAEPPTPTLSPTVEDEPTATASPTTEAGVTPSPTSEDSGNLPQNPNPTYTPTVASGSGIGYGNGSGSSGGVTTLPSTGTSGASNGSSAVMLILLAGLILLASTAFVRLRSA